MRRSAAFNSSVEAVVEMLEHLYDEGYIGGIRVEFAEGLAREYGRIVEPRRVLLRPTRILERTQYGKA